MSDVIKSSSDAHIWVPFTIEHLLEKHGLREFRSLFLLTIWIVLIAISIASVFFLISGSWVDGTLDQSAINSFFMFYPPLIIGTLLLFWLGFEWGFIPVFLATFVIAFASEMPIYWAILFAFAFVLGLGIYALSYYCVPLDKSLRDIKSFAFFVVISFIASISSSLGAFIWSFAHDMTVTQSTILWRGWWTGMLLQSVIIIGPLLFLLTPYVEKIKIKWFDAPTVNEVTLNWIYGAILSVSVVLGLFIIGSNSLGMQMLNDLTSGLTASVTEQFLQATKSFQTVTWISISLILSMGLGSVYLVGSWNNSLNNEVNLKTSELEESRLQIQESLKEKEEILEGIHHRMRSNLTIMLALLEIQLKYTGEKKLDDVLQDSYSRLQSLSIVYETMHQTRSVNSLNIKIYAIKLLNRLNHSAKYKDRKVESIVKSDDICIDLDRAIPLAMVINELIENTYQHAYNYNIKGILRLTMLEDQNNNLLKIEVSDNSKRFSKNSKLYDKKNLSLKLIRLLIEQINGNIEIADQSTSLIRIAIPLTFAEMDKSREMIESPELKDTVRAELI